MGNYSMSIADIEAAIKKQEEYKSGNVGYAPKTDKLPTLKKVVEKPVESKTTSVDLPKANSSALPDMNLAILSRPQTNGEKLDKWLSDGYKLSKEEKKEAKAFIKDYRKNNKYPIGDPNATKEDVEAFKKITALDSKLSSGTAFWSGMTDSIPLLDSLQNKMVSDNEEAKAILEETRGALEDSAEQNKGMATAGRIAGELAKYNAGSQIAQSIPVLQKATGAVGQSVENLSKSAKLGNAVQNVLGDTALDVALDTIPTAIENAQSGMNGVDVAKEAGKNVATNLAFNIGGEAISNAMPVLKKIADNKKIRNTDDIVSLSDIADEIPINTNMIGMNDLKTQKELLLKQFSDFADGKFPRSERFTISDSMPQYFQNYGNADNPLQLRQRKYKDITSPKNDKKHMHGLSDVEVARIIDDINSPVAVFESGSIAGRPVVVGGRVDADEHPIMSAIQMDETTDAGTYNKLATSFGKDTLADDLLKARSENRMLFENKEKVDELISGGGLQSSKRDTNINLSDNSISNPQNNVNDIAKEVAKKFDIKDYPDATDAYKSTKKNIHNMFNMFGSKEQEEVVMKAVDEFVENPSIEKYIEVQTLLGNEADKLVGTEYHYKGNKAQKLGKTRKFDKEYDYMSAFDSVDELYNSVRDRAKANVNKVMPEDIGLRKTNEVSIPNTAEYGDISIEGGMNKYSNVTAINKTDYDESVKKMLIDNPQFYEIAKNVDTKKTADYIVDNNPIEFAYSDFLHRVETKDPVSIPLGYRLVKKYAESGNTDMAVEIVQKMSSELTKAGQFTQAAAIDLLKENPMAAMRYMEKQINKMNQKGIEKFGKKWPDLKLTDDEVKAFSSIEPNDTEAIKGLYDSISKRIAKECPSTMWEKVVEASKTAMMLNPRTHLRNVTANAIMAPVRSLGDRVSALGQNAVKLFNTDMTVTQSLVGGSKAQKKIADDIFEESIKPLLKNTEKWEDVTNSVLHDKQVFKDSKLGSLSKKVSVGTLGGINKLTGGRLEKLVELADEKVTGSIMENLRRFDYWLLGDVEDDVFVKKNFSNRLASYMKAQGINSADDVPAEAISIAYEEALKATFKDDNAITRTFSGLKKNTGKFGEVVLPFTKTPANIAARGLDYSPYGVVNAIKQAKGKESVDKVIDTLSKSALGTGGIAVGYMLAKEGLIQGALSSDKDQQQFEKQQGKQAFSINVNGNYYTYDWAQPAAIPLIIGSAIYDGIKESDGEIGSYFNIGLQATKAGVDAWADLSPVSSLQDILGGGTYSSDSVADNVANEILEFPQRLYPAALTATAKTMDPTYRQTYTKGDVLQTQIDTLKSKIPVLSKDLPVSYDTWGNERKRQDSTESAAFANFVNPGSLGYDASTPLDGEIERLFEATQSKSVFPNKAEWSVKAANGKTIDLTNQQYSDYQKTMGQTSYEFAEAFMQSDMYANMSDEDKADKLSTLYSVAKSMAKSDLFGSQTSEENLKYINAYKQGGTQGLMDYIQEKHTLDSAGISSTNEIAKEYYANGNFDEYQEINNAIKSYGFDTNDSSSMKFINQYGLDAYKDAGDAIEQLGMKQSSENRKLYMSGGLPVLRMAKAADNNNDGSVSKKNELIPYLKNQSWSAEEKNRVVEQFGFSTKNLKW